MGVKRKWDSLKKEREKREQNERLKQQVADLEQRDVDKDLAITEIELRDIDRDLAITELELTVLELQEQQGRINTQAQTDGQAQTEGEQDNG